MDLYLQVMTLIECLMMWMRVELLYISKISLLSQCKIMGLRDTALKTHPQIATAWWLINRIYNNSTIVMGLIFHYRVVDTSVRVTLQARTLHAHQCNIKFIPPYCINNLSIKLLQMEVMFILINRYEINFCLISL